MKKLLLPVATACILFCTSQLVSASETIGTILPSFKTTKVCQDVTCTNFGLVNFAPTLNAMTPGAAAVTITDTSITGHAWGNQIGWINLSPTGLTSAQTLKVNPTTGVITGLGFANTGSWVNFSPISGGVTINALGEFVGWAWVSGAYGGWMKFDCANSATCIKTDWRPIPYRTVVVVNPPGGGGGGCIVNCLPVTTPTPPLPSTPPNTPGAPQIPKIPKQGGSTRPKLVKNTFDPNATGEPNQPPTKIIDTTQNVPGGTTDTSSKNQEGEYRQAFPYSQPGFTSEKNCFWCIVVRRDSISTQKIMRNNSGNILATQTINKERHIIKYGFVPKKYEIRLPLSKIFPKPAGTTPRTDLDLTSTGLTLLVLALIRKIITLVI
jgi:hypothetical protein